MSNVLVITRHKGLVEYLKEKGFVPDDCEVLGHATPDNVAGKDVWGVLPHSLSCLCSSFTEVPMTIPAELRGKELSLEDMRQYAGEPVTYKVRVVK